MSEDQDVDRLRSQVETLQSELNQLRRQLALAELETWRARIDDAEVQVHLASLGAQDRIEPLIEGLRNAWLDAQATVTATTDTASDVIDNIRTGLERTMADLRRALLETARARSSDSA